ncbi:hypothetical protein [Clostridium sp. 001]|uniref:hypothetical protein n=1 Tax=Clostridium sp. 001 TaxID=1970093 RepID=UPI001C2BD305|nr:hypothetical protein [Clostridium sp. 001]QXE20040.1 hypothetical protein B5S50_15070 [Clostridium sp. 001]
MNKYIEQIPGWWTEKGKYNLCLSDDIDSLMSCYYLSMYKDWSIEYFYDFNRLYCKSKINRNECIGVDIDLLEGRCLGNHVVNNSNKDCINLNRFARIESINYTSKYAGNTILMVLSLLNVDINNFTEQQQEILLSVDCMFKSYYFDKNMARYYISDILGYPELIHILKNRTKEYFYNILEKYNLHSNIKCKDGYLHTDIKLEELNEIFKIKLQLPKEEFFICQNFGQGTGTPNKNTKLFSYALTYRNSGKYSYYI